jgi:hypothetical protein
MVNDVGNPNSHRAGGLDTVLILGGTKTHMGLEHWLEITSMCKKGVNYPN